MTPAEILRDIERQMLAAPPAGLSPAQVQAYIRRNAPTLVEAVMKQLEAAAPRRPVGGDRVVTLNHGLGRDSFTMLCLLLEGKLVAQGTRVKLSDVSAVVCSDTGGEWKHTYATLPLVEELCRQAGLRFLHLKKPPAEGSAGYRQWLEGKDERAAAKALAKDQGRKAPRFVPAWRASGPDSIEERAKSGFYHLRAPIREDYQSRCTVISLNRQDCTANHKIQPIRRLVEDLAREIFDVESNREWGKHVREGKLRPHLALIGYAANETRRLEHDVEGPDYATEAYPLVEMGITKRQEAQILERWQLGHVRKSGCRVCPFQPVAWYWALRETDPEGWAELLEYEAASLSRNPRMTVLPSGPRLEEAVERWRRANPEATVDEVLDKAYTRCQVAHQAPAGETFEALTESCELHDSPTLLAVRARVLLRSFGEGGALS